MSIPRPRPFVLALSGSLVGIWSLAVGAARLPAAVAMLEADGSRTSAPAPAASWPETPAGRIGRGWFDAFLRGEPAMRRFLSDNLAPESLVERGVESRLGTYRRLREELGRLQLVEVTEDEPLRVTVTFRDEHDLRHEFTFVVAETEPHRLQSIQGRVTQRHGLFPH